MEQESIYQWDEVYPDELTIRKDMANGELYAGIVDGRIAVIYVINKYCDNEYSGGAWQYQGDNYRIVHRLCVHPDFQNIGVGRGTMEYIEEKLCKEGVGAIRLDAFTENPYAIRLYKSLGYKIVGYANWRKGRFYLMEKLIK